MKLLIIADDFTGSNDTGVQFAKKKLSTIVTTRYKDIADQLFRQEVLVVDTESRFDDAQTAYRKVYDVTRQALRQQEPVLYKKIDSTFRGNIGAEISACLDASGKAVAIMVPALPSNGRTTKGGTVYVNGTLLHETEVSNDPKTPVWESYIPEILRSQTDKKVEVIAKEGSLSRQVLWAGIEKARRLLAEIIIIDAETKEDLETIAAVIAELPKDYILVGTAGLAEMLPDALNLYSPQGILSIIGSVSEVTRKQVEYVMEREDVDVIYFSVEMMFDQQRKQEVLDFAAGRLRKGRDVIIYTAKDQSAITNTLGYAASHGIDFYEMSDHIAKTLGEMAGILMKNCQEHLAGVYVTGGDTLIKIAEELDISGMVIEEEVLPAIPLGYFLQDDLRDIKIVTKAGAFGKEDAFQHILKALRR